jgi:hypothetical protein
MKLISDKEIEDAANHYAELSNGEFGNDLYPNTNQTLNEVSIIEYKEGVYFAEQKLKPFILDFMEWLKEQPILICQTASGNKWVSSYSGGGFYTSEQLLEQFIEQRNK